MRRWKKNHDIDKQGAFIFNIVAPSGFKMQNIKRINSLCNVRLKSYFLKGLEPAMLLKDSRLFIFFWGGGENAFILAWR